MSAISSFASAFSGGQMPRPVRAILTPLADDVPPPTTSPDGQARVFQYFPDTFTDSRQVDYQRKPIPGLSHPLYQWTTGGERVIAFTAIFTRDKALTTKEKQSLGALLTGNFQGINNGMPYDMRNVDIPSAVSWLRSYTYPEYGTTATNKYDRPRPPRRLILTLPGTRINQGTPELTADDIRCIMTQCEVSYEGFFNDGTPRIARVNLAFEEIIQYGGGVTPVGALGLRNVGLGGYTLTKPKAR